MTSVWIVCGGPSTEYEVSLNSGRQVARQFAIEGMRAKPVVVTRDGQWLIPAEWIGPGAGRDWIENFFDAVEGERPSVEARQITDAVARMREDGVGCVFLAIHGQYGEDGRIQGFLDILEVPYTGSGLEASLVAFDKYLTLDAYRRAGLNTARGVLVGPGRETLDEALGLRFPVFAKPVRGGSSVGVSYVATPEGLREAIAAGLAVDENVLVEEKITGVEVSCGVIEMSGEDATPTALPPTEIRPVDAEYFDYSAKYVAGKSQEITPARLPEATIREVQRLAVAAHGILGCSGMSRTDMIVQADGTPVLLETNTIPGLTATSLLPQQCAAAGISFGRMVEILILRALAGRQSGAFDPRQAGAAG